MNTGAYILIAIQLEERDLVREHGVLVEDPQVERVLTQPPKQAIDVGAHSLNPRARLNLLLLVKMLIQSLFQFTNSKKRMSRCECFMGV